MAQKGILFKTAHDGPPTSIHRDALNKVTATANIVNGVVELSFTLKFVDASIVERPSDLSHQAYWPFVEGTQEIDLINPRTRLTQSKRDNPASFDITVDWPDGKIGGASAWRVIEENGTQKEYSE